jgi:hypothetical protein
MGVKGNIFVTILVASGKRMKYRTGLYSQAIPHATAKRSIQKISAMFRVAVRGTVSKILT